MTTKIIAGDLAVAGEVKIDNTISSLGNIILKLDKDINSSNSYFAITDDGADSTGVFDNTNHLITISSNGVTTKNSFTAIGDFVTGAGDIITVAGDISTTNGSVLTNKVASTSNLLLQIDSDDNTTTGVLAVTKNGATTTVVRPSGIPDYTLLTLNETGNMAVLGSITANGSMLSFTGSHVYPSLTDLSEHAGAVVELVEGSHLELCSTADSKKVAGILVSCKPKEEFGTSSLGEIPESMGFVCTVAAVGDSRTSDLLGVKVCDEGGALEPGDLLVTSSRAGYLKKQQDDIIRASTVAKVMQPVTFDDTGAATGVYSYVYCG